MRILNRPMFRYGGPIKEGVMHGMRNGGRAALVGNPVYPKTDGREHHKLNILNPMNWKNMFLGAGAYAKNPTVGSKVVQGIKNIFGRTTPATGELYKTPFKPASFNVHPFWARDPVVKSALWGKRALTSPTAKNIGEKIVQGIATPTGIGLTLVGTKWLWPDGKEANENEIKEHLNQGGGEKWDPGAGADQIITQSMKDKIAKDAQNKTLKSYLDMMGYDRSKKTAMSDALIDASALVQDATTEAGSIKHADWGKLINKMIQTTSKRYDKPEQIREAVGLMSVKAAIQKDMEDPEAKKLRRMQIKKIEDELEGNSFAENKILTAKNAPGQAGYDLAV